MGTNTVLRKYNVTVKQIDQNAYSQMNADFLKQVPREAAALLQYITWSQNHGAPS